MIPWGQVALRFFQNMVNSSLGRAIIKTLCYSQIFSYPLTRAELWKYLLHNKKVSKKTLTRYLFQNPHIFEQIQDYVVLRGDKKLISERVKRHAYSSKKLKKAIIISRILFCIPTIKLVGISGSLSMFNAKKDDDIDLFFITSKKTLWTTRFMVNVALCILRQKRMREDRYAKDKICPNMFMSEDNLHIKKTDQNIYTAHEIAQMRVLFSNKNTYQRFISHNAWVLRYIPNAFTISKNAMKREKKSLNVFLIILSPIEKFFYGIQYLYMKKRITNETVTKTSARFYSSYHKKAILALYDLKTACHMDMVMGTKRTKIASNYKHMN